MRREQSQQNAPDESAPGHLKADKSTLFVVGVPIGHPDDVTIRALRVLRQADVIASEDPAATQRLLSYHGIDRPLTSYGPTNMRGKVAVFIHRLQRGARIAIVSDCGSPVIADPGCLLVAAAHSHGIQVVSVPGPSALTAAVAATGLSGDSFFFQGRLPDTKSLMRRCLAGLLTNQTPTVAFCSQKSLTLALMTMAEIASQRFLVLACDLTKPQEKIIRGNAGQIQRILSDCAQTTQDVTFILEGSKTSMNARARKKKKRAD